MAISRYIGTILFYVVLLLNRAICQPLSNDSLSTTIHIKCDKLVGTSAKLLQPSALTAKEKNLDSSKFNNFGEAILRIKTNKFEFVDLKLTNQLIHLFIVPDHTINIDLKTEDSTLQIKFSGKYAKASEFLLYSSLILKKYQSLDNKPLIQLNEADFFDRINQIENSFNELLNSYTESTFLDQEILTLLKQRNHMQLTMYKYSYAQANFNINKASSFQDSILNDLRGDAMKDFFLLNANSIEYETVLNSYLQFFISTPINNRYNKAGQDLNYHLPTLCDEQIMRNLYPAPIRIYLRARNFIEQVSSSDPRKYIDTLYNSLKNDAHFLLYKNEITDAYTRYSNLKKG